MASQPLMHAILLNALPIELRHLAAASKSSPEPYGDFCAAELACYSHTYRPLRWSREFQASPSSQRALPTGPQPSLEQDLTSPATTPPTSRPATSALIPAPEHPPDVVQEVPATIGQSTERSVFSTASAHGPSGASSPTSAAHDTSETSGSTTATSLRALESAMERDIVTPAIRPPIAEASPAMMSNETVFSSTSTLSASCKHQPTSFSKSPAADVQAHAQLWPNVRDAATMTENPEDHPPGPSHVEQQTAYALPATQAETHLPPRTRALLHLLNNVILRLEQQRLPVPPKRLITPRLVAPRLSAAHDSRLVCTLHGRQCSSCS
ncbi:hypothetical protein HPB52_007582 [Rhipicephalus sanguineus]|uniref:Uncharacterized protein n=1 Tax=Rhipicephalus sanguineus TaxID=34632 RepID=A0A9D4PFY8_RHISA|nr:hypothetical protein HPB52_007582 [Rhipicephalus sanguineus]